MSKIWRELFKALFLCGSGITFDDIADRAKEWGLFEDPKCCNIFLVMHEVLKEAKCVDAEKFNS